MKTSNLLFFIAILLHLPLPLMSQRQAGWPGDFFRGYEKSVRGGGFQYHSPQPDVNSSLLVRSLDSTQYIEWESQVVPHVRTIEASCFIWLFGIDANNDSHAFRLFVNGKYCLAFSNPLVSELKPWIVTGESGASITFRTTMLDKYSDPMGYAILTLPDSLVVRGRPQRFKVIGETAGSRSWYMTFETAIREQLDISQEESVIRHQDKNSYSLLFDFVHLGNMVKGTIEIQGIQAKTFLLQPGFNSIRVLYPETLAETEISVLIKKEGYAPEEKKVVIKPPRRRTIYLVQHTHTDIGYTRPQTEILPEHLRYIDDALDFCDQTDTLPEAAQFRWTCETSWAVREYLKTRPQDQVERLKRRVKEGRIELTGLFLNSSDLGDEPVIAATLQPVKYFRDKGFPVRAAMQSDINGVPWCLVDYLSCAGIQYLNMAQNTHRALKPFNRPVSFWWESPSGKRILVNRPEHYMWGNNLGILTNLETFGKNLFKHLREIEVKGYPFDMYAIQFSGYLTDNSPPSTRACSLVQQWNQFYEWPKLRLATISGFIDDIAKNHGTELPVIRGAWPDWWMDGFGSAAIQTAQARKAHVDYIANQGLMSMAVILGIPSNQHLRDLQDQITDDLAFYDEHTFGAAESITDPLCENSVVQLGEKESYVWEAVKKNSILREEIMGRLQSFFPATGSPVITVINTLNWPRSGVVTVYIDHQIIPTDHKFKIIDIDGQEIPAQPVASREDGTYLALQVSDIPPLGFRTYRVQIENQPDKAPAVTKFTGVFEDNHYRIMVDTLAGKIRSIYDKELEQELTDPDPEYFTGDFIYERLGKNRAQLEHLRLEEYTRETWKSIRVSDIRNGPVWKSIIITGQMPGCADQSGIRCEIRLYKNEKKLEFCYSMKKLPVTDPEGVYVAFPFTLPGSELVYEVAGGTVVPGKDQVEGSASDWNGIQNFVAVRSRSHQIVFVSPEIPLVQLGDLNLGKFTRIGNLTSPIAYPLSPVIFSWVLNNYWTTNFLASQEGELKWTYQITSCRDTSIFFATRFGWSNRIPMLTRVSQGGKPESDLTPRSFLGLSTGNLLMVSIRPSDDGNGLIMQLREIAGKQDSIPVFDNRLSSLTLSMATGAISAWEVNVIGETVKKLWEKLPDIKADTQPVWMTFKPRETKFLELSFTRPKN